MSNLSWEDFTKVDIRVGTILSAEVFAEARKPAYKIQIDFGALGIRKTSAQVTVLYTAEELVGRQVLAVVNFPPKQIANFMSECLLLGIVGEGDSKGVVTIVGPDKKVENGLRLA